MLRGFSGNLTFAIIARMLCGNHLNTWKLVRFSLFKPCVGNDNCKDILAFLKGFFAKKKKDASYWSTVYYRTCKVNRKRNNINIMGYVRCFSLLSSDHAFISIISQANFNKK